MRRPQALRDHVRDPRQALDELGSLRVIDGSSTPPEPDTEHQQVGELRHETFCGGDTDFGARVRIEAGVRHAWDRAAIDVGDRKDLRSAFFRRLGCHERVDGLSRLTHRDHQIPFADDGVSATELACELGDGRHLGELFQPIAACDGRVMAGAAGEEDHPLDALGVVVAQADFGREDVGVLAVEPPAQGVFERARLLEDFLQHEVLVSVLLGHDRRPGDLPGATAHGSTVERRQGEASGFEHGDLPVFEEHHLVGVWKERRNIARAVGRALRHAEHERG